MNRRNFLFLPIVLIFVFGLIFFFRLTEKSFATTTFKFPWLLGSSNQKKIGGGGGSAVNGWHGSSCPVGIPCALDFFTENNPSSDQTKVLAAADGTITKVRSCSISSFIYIQTGDTTLQYFHLRSSDFTYTQADEGKTIKQGAALGHIAVGNFNEDCGHAELQPNNGHLHLAILNPPITMDGWYMASKQKLTKDGVEAGVGSYLTSTNTIQISKAGEHTRVGDFNDDGLDDIALFYDYGNSSMKIWVQISTGSSFQIQEWYSSNAGDWDVHNMQDIKVGNFDGQGGDDIAVLYKYPNQRIKIWIFKSTGNSFQIEQWYDSGEGNWNMDNVKGNLVAGNYDADTNGKTDLAIMYKYPNYRAKIWVFKSTGTSFTIQSWYDSGEGNWNMDNVKDNLVAGNYDADTSGKTDLAIMYKYPNYRAKIWVFKSTGTSFTIQSWYDSGEGNWNMDNVKGNLVAGNYDADTNGRTDLAIMYKYPNYRAKIWVFKSTGTSFTIQSWYDSGEGNWNVDNMKTDLMLGNFDGEYGSDLAVMFDYQNNTLGIWMFKSTGSAFQEIIWYASEVGHWNFDNSFYEQVGQFNTNGLSDIFTLYRYPNNQAKTWNFLSTGQLFNIEEWYDSGPSNWNMDNAY